MRYEYVTSEVDVGRVGWNYQPGVVVVRSRHVSAKSAEAEVKRTGRRAYGLVSRAGACRDPQVGEKLSTYDEGGFVYLVRPPR